MFALIRVIFGAFAAFSLVIAGISRRPPMVRVHTATEANSNQQDVQAAWLPKCPPRENFVFGAAGALTLGAFRLKLLFAPIHQRGSVMGSLYKRRDSGGLRKAKWFASYIDAHGKRRRRSTGTTDKQTASQILARWETEAAKRRSGLIDAGEERLSSQGSRPIEEHLNEFTDKLTSAGKSAVHIKRTRQHIETIIEFAAFRTLADIQPEGVESYVADLKTTHNRSARTCQAHIQSIKSFTRWAKRTGRIASNPLDIVDRPNPDRDRRLERRALSVEEWQLLKSATENGPVRMGMAPLERALLYEVALQTGLRAKELRQLTRGRLHLGSEPPFILAPAATTKGGELARQYVTVDLGDRLSDFVARKTPGAPVFAMTEGRRTADMIREDLAVARAAWIQEAETDAEREQRESSDFLAAIDGNGARFDFHALRHSCGTWLALAGVHPKAIQSVMRHSTITLTLDRYGHLLPSMEATAIADMGRMVRGADPRSLAREKQAGGSRRAKGKGRRRRSG